MAANDYEPTTFFFVATLQHTLLSPLLSERNRNPHTHTLLPWRWMDGWDESAGNVGTKAGKVTQRSLPKVIKVVLVDLLRELNCGED